MSRPILKLGDKSTSGGVVIEGIPSCTHDGVPITFIGAKVWCNACNSEGVIGSKGPHHDAIIMGKQQALDGDICLCKCTPAPIMLASQRTASHVFVMAKQPTTNGNVELLAGGEGTPGNNQAQNKQFNDVVRIQGLTPDQARQLHDEISGEGLGFHEMMERAQDMFGD